MNNKLPDQELNQMEALDNIPLKGLTQLSIRFELR